MEARSLSSDEATQRAALVEVQHYDLDVDLTDLLVGDAFRVRATIDFRCAEAGAETFLDCLADVEEATLNGRPQPVGPPPDGRIALRDLQHDNIAVVATVQRATGAGRGVHRAVDPADGEVYVWTTFEPDDARVAFACFDQPDLKASFAITVTAPPAWTVLSNSGDAEVTDVDGARRWAFAPTPRLSSYLPVVNAGPLHETRSERAGHDLGLYARRSLAAQLDRDADELFELTASGLAFYGEQFQLPFPQRRYDQVFMPEFGGAMENWGCVTWADSFIYREAPSYAERELRAVVLLHEMAHMWFGDMVTMRWWDDLWLNESFAEWACAWAATRVTEFTDVWAGMLVTDKRQAYAADVSPTTHPIRQEVTDTAAAAASFDEITYPKGAAVLKQLVAFVGEDTFVTALAAYFRTYAWGNATLDDLVAELEGASGRDLSEWVTGWLETSGTDNLSLERSDTELVLRAQSPGERPPLPHRLHVGIYEEADESFALQRSIPVDVTGERTPLAAVAPSALLVLNDDDLTFASSRPDRASLDRLLADGGGLPTAVGRALAVTTAWDLLYRGDVGAEEFVRCVTDVLARESADSVIEPMLALAVEAADYWAPTGRREDLLAIVADTCIGLADEPARRLPAVRALSRTASTPGQLAELQRRADTPDLRWRRLTRLAALDRLDDAEVQTLLEVDPNPDAWVSAETTQAARPDADAKQHAWDSAVVRRTLPMDAVFEVGLAFWRPGQEALLAPYRRAYVEALPALGSSGMMWAISLSRAMFPRSAPDDGFVEELADALADPAVSPAVRQHGSSRLDLLRRMLVARGA